MADQISARRFPFIAVPRAWLLYLTSDELKVAIALGAHADRDGQAYPSVRTLARETCLCANTIRKCLAGLETKGVLTMEARRRPNGAFTSYLYTVDLTGSDLRGGSSREPGGGSRDEGGVVHDVKQGGSCGEPGGGSCGEPAYELDPSSERDPLNEIQVKVEPTPAVSPVSLPTWDQYGMQYETLPWEDAHHNLDQGFIDWLVTLWSGKGKDKATVMSMTLLFLRKCRRSQSDYQKTADHWRMYQASRQEQQQKAQQDEAAELEAAELRKWMRQGY